MQPFHCSGGKQKTKYHMSTMDWMWVVSPRSPLSLKAWSREALGPEGGENQREALGSLGSLRRQLSGPPWSLSGENWHKRNKPSQPVSFSLLQRPSLCHVLPSLPGGPHYNWTDPGTMLLSLPNWELNVPFPLAVWPFTAATQSCLIQWSVKNCVISMTLYMKEISLYWYLKLALH